MSNDLVIIDRKRFKRTAEGFVWYGEEKSGSSYVFLTLTQGRALGKIVVGGNIFQVLPLQSGLQALLQLTPKALNTRDSVIVTASSQDAIGASYNAQLSQNDSVIRILVAYTPAAESNLPGALTINDVINNYIAETNTTFSNSLINTSVEVAYIHEVVYTESSTGGISWDLHNFKETNGVMDEVQGLGNDHDADVAVLLVHNMSDYTSGVMQYTGNRNDNAYTVVNLWTALYTYTFTHELGHVLYCHHNVEDLGLFLDPQVVEPRFGYRDFDWFNWTYYRTVMAYRVPDSIKAAEGRQNGGSVQHLYFSDPNLYYSEWTTGGRHDFYFGDQSTMNAQTVRDHWQDVANYRLGDGGIDPLFSVEDANNDSKSDFDFKLHKSYPNPFSDQTTIHYTLSESSSIRMTVHNILGQEVVRVLDGNQPAGYHSVVWDGTNSSSDPVASGLYIIRLMADGNESRNYVTLGK